MIDKVRNEFTGDAGNVVQARSIDTVNIYSPGRDTPPPQQLPNAGSAFVGRGRPMAFLDTCLVAEENSKVCAIGGPPGVGKTAVAVQWAHDRRDRFPDGILFADLRGSDDANPIADPGEVLDGFLDALGLLDSVPALNLQAKSTLYRSALSSKKMLVVLDDAATAEQVRPLLPGASETFVLITSRARLSSLQVREGAVQVDITPLPVDEAVELLRRTIGSEAVNAELEAARELAEMCACLPLALRIAADRVASGSYGSLGDLAADLRDERDRLDVLDSDDPSTAVRTVFSVSYRSLPRAAARVFRLLGLHPGAQFGIAAAAALTGERPVALRRNLDLLRDANLIERLHPDRYRLHDLLRVYAAECAAAEESEFERREAQRAVLSWYLGGAANADALLNPHRRRVPVDVSAGAEFADSAEALDWCGQEQSSLAAAVRLAAELEEHDLTWRLAASLWSFYYQRKPWGDWIETHWTALRSAERLEDPYAVATIAGGMAIAQRELRDYDEAETLFTRALTAWTSINDRYGEAWVCNGYSQMCRELGRLDEAVALAQRALDAWHQIGDRYGQGMAHNSLSGLLLQRGDLDAALARSNDAVAAFREVRDRYSTAWALSNLGNVRRARGEIAEAAEIYEKVAAERGDLGDHYGRAFTLRSMGEALIELDREQEGIAALRSALEFFDGIGDPRTADIRAVLESHNVAADTVSEER